MIPAYLDRTVLLLGTGSAERLGAARVLAVGLGGVGSWCAELLVRAGVADMVLLDGDCVADSNRNRQLPALCSTLGRSKAEVLAERFADLNPAGRFVPECRFLTPENVTDLPPFDLVIDAIDDVPAKVALLAHCVESGIPVVSSMGAGGKLDPARIRTGDIGKTEGCRLARAVRQGLRARGIGRGIPVVFSPEPVAAGALRRDAEGTVVGTISYLPAMFGGMLAYLAVRVLTEGEAPQGESPARPAR